MNFAMVSDGKRPVDRNTMRTEVGLERDLFQVVIDVTNAGSVFFRWQLTLLGITETAIFPDLEGLARELRLEYRIDRSRPIS